METERQGQGKIHRLPFERRMELHALLLNNSLQAKTLTWLNALPEWVDVRPLFDDKDITPQNLSDYKTGKDYQKWARRQERISDLRTLSAFSRGLGEATAGALTDGAADIAGGKILERLELLIEADGDNEEIDQLIDTLVKLRTGDHKRQELMEKRLTRVQKDKLLKLRENEFQLERDKIETQGAERMLEMARSEEVQSIINSKSDRASKIQQLRKVMFPQRKEAS